MSKISKFCPFCGSKRVESYRTLSDGYEESERCKKCGACWALQDVAYPDVCFKCNEYILGERSYKSIHMANGKVKHNRCRGKGYVPEA